MRCKNCDVEAGTRGNRHVSNRRYTCTRKTNTSYYSSDSDSYVVYDMVDNLIPDVPDFTDYSSSSDYSGGGYDYGSSSSDYGSSSSSSSDYGSSSGSSDY